MEWHHSQIFAIPPSSTNGKDRHVHRLVLGKAFPTFMKSYFQPACSSIQRECGERRVHNQPTGMRLFGLYRE